MEIPGWMQATLVAYYGDKTGNLLDMIRACQNKLSELLLASFRPYELEQVHGTIIGLEGCRVGDSIRNENFRKFRKEERLMSPEKLLEFLRSDEFTSFKIRVGGYRHHLDYGFLSRSKHPYLRSFSIQGEIAVAMGWPFDGDSFPDVLDKLRYRFNDLNVLHAWHRKQGDIDNDFYFVLGRVDRRFLSDVQIQRVEEEMRLFLAGINTLIFPIDKAALSIVGFLDTQLPIQTSCSFRITDQTLNASKFLSLYPSCETAA
jgi:hypothetical protein